jgi:integral membrane sensor domain MASE1
VLQILAVRIRSSAVVFAGLVGLAYLGAAEAGHLLSFKENDAALATFWPPSGLLVAVLALARPRAWPPLLLGAAAANALSDIVLHGQPPLASLGFLVANGLEACLGAVLLRRLVGPPLALTRLREVLGLAGYAALVATACGATVGAAVVALAFDVPYGVAWLRWWLGSAVGVVLVAPLVLTWLKARPSFPAGLRPGRLAEGFAVFAGLLLTAEGVFGGWLPLPLVVPVYVLPFLLWAGMRFGPRGASLAILAMGALAVWHVAHGEGPYAALTTDLALQRLRAQGGLVAASLCVLVLAAVVAERKRMDRKRLLLIQRLQGALVEIKTLRGLIPICAWCKKIRDDRGFWQQLETYLTAHARLTFSHGICPACMTRHVPPPQP